MGMGMVVSNWMRRIQQRIWWQGCQVAECEASGKPGEARTLRTPVRVISRAFIRLWQSSGGGGRLPEKTKNGPAEAAGRLVRRDQGSELWHEGDQPPHSAAARARGGARAGSEKAGNRTGISAGGGTGSDAVGGTGEKAGYIVGSRAGGGTRGIWSNKAREEIDCVAGSRAGEGTGTILSSRAGGGTGCTAGRRASEGTGRIPGSRAGEGTGCFVSSRAGGETSSRIKEGAEAEGLGWRPWQTAH
ncbi:circumsporozoite protein-like [Alligator sinensis]|uniref:Circumsporozoite protein-like n=1 Tax=Alligator sinensis TaxID=38654 RepID=A0A3Q0H7F5_ALLSI|nr:circumsporozoite protein-like [Alligator sinensis]